MIKMYKSLRLLLIILLGINMGSSAQTAVFSTPSSTPYPYVVPPGVTGITVTAKGATGGLNSDETDYPDRRGYGGCVTAVITVTPGQVLQVYVGGCGGNGTSLAGGAGGVNGGAPGEHGLSIYSGGGGGGASDVRLTSDPADRLVVAGGGGGAGLNCGGDDDRGGDGGPAPFPGGDGGGCGTTTGGSGGGSAGVVPVPGVGGICPSCVFPGVAPGSAGTSTDGGAGGAVSAGGGGGGGYAGGGGGSYSGGGGGGNYVAPGVFAVTNSRGCNTTGCGSVTITVTCTAGVITGSGNVCVGSTIILTDATAGGSWVSSDVSVATVGSMGDVTGVSAGVVTISYELIPGVPGCRAVRTITVNPLPAAITSPAPFVCEGSSITISDITTGGTWSASNGNATIVGSTGVVTGVAAGLDTFYYTLPTGCSAFYSLLIQPLPAPITGPTQVCEGGTITLSDITGGGSWSSVSLCCGGIVSIGATTGVVNGVTAGTVTISYTWGVCASTYVVTVNPIPSSITGPIRVCMGSTIKDTSATPGGTYTCTPVLVATVNPVTGVVTPIAPGVATITYTLPTGCSRSLTITVNALPSAIAGLSVVCEGSTIALSDPSGAGTWSSSNTAVATVGGTGIVTGVGIIGVGGVDTITFTLTTTGCKAIKSVTVNPKPDTIKGPDPVCTGTTSLEITGPYPGTWTPTVSAIGTIDAAGNFLAIAPGTVTITFTLPTGCIRTRVMTVNLTPVPITGPTSVCEAASITLSDATPGGTWSSLDAPTLVTLGPGAGVVNGVSAGVATITYAMATGCKATYQVTVSPNPVAIFGTKTSICQGDTTLLTDATPGGTWVSNLLPVATVGSTDGIVLGMGGGVAIIDYIMPSGCFVSYTMNVSSTPTPISLPHKMCLGSTPVVVASGGGAGDWSSSNNLIATVTLTGPATGTITSVSIGVDTICYFFSAAPGCQTCMSFTVNPIPSAITGPNSVCTGFQITESSTSTGGTWTFTNGRATVNAITGVVTGVTSGLDTLIYTLNGCSVTKVINVNQSPAPITGTLSICQGLTTVLTEATGGGSWSVTAVTGSCSIAPVFSTTTTVTGISAGTVLIDYTTSNGCYAQATLTVSSLSTPITGPSQVCVGSTITLTETISGTWSSAPTTVATVVAGPATSTVLTGVAPGTAAITFTSLGCQTTKTVTVYQTPIAIITPLSTTNLCPGDVVALTATTGAGYTYQWRNGVTVIPGATSSTYITGTAGNYNVIITLGPCQATSAFVPVTMNPVVAGLSPTVSTVCASTPPTLTATPPGMSYQWILGGVPIPGAIGATYVATASGTYTVKVTNAFGCNSTSPAATVTLVASPVASVTPSGPTTFCAGGSVTFTTSTGAGYTYQWKLGGLPIAGATTSTFTATVAGSYTVTILNTIGCSTTSTAIVVTISPAPPAAIAPSGSVIRCYGGSVVLTAPVGAYYYQWYKGGIAITGATAGAYTATANGSYTVKVTSIAGGCSATSAATTLTVVPLPVISPLSATSFCWGGSVTLTATVLTGIGTVNYQWWRNGVIIPGATAGSYVATTTGMYTVDITIVLGGCTMTTVGTYVTEWPLPNPLITFDGTYFHTGTFVTYQWYKNGIAIPGATSSTRINSGLGSYTVRVTDSHGCQSLSSAYILSTLVSSSHGTSGAKPGEDANGVINNMGEIRIFPNPAQNVVHIEWMETVHAYVCSMDGRTLIDKPDATDIDLSSLANGIYVIKLYDANGELLKVEKLVKSAN